MIKFGVVGVLNTAIDFGLYYLLSRYVFTSQYVLCKMISYFGGTLNSYLFNKYWTFKSKEKISKEAVSFLIINVSSWVINSGAMYVCVHYLELHDMLSFFIATFLSFMFNFWFQKMITFKV